MDEEDYEWDGVWHEFIAGSKLDPKPLERTEQLTHPEQTPEQPEAGAEQKEQPPEPPEASEEREEDEDVDFSDFEDRLVSGDYDWEDDD